jgi:hypothetical protein
MTVCAQSTKEENIKPVSKQAAAMAASMFASFFVLSLPCPSGSLLACSCTGASGTVWHSESRSSSAQCGQKPARHRAKLSATSTSSSSAPPLCASFASRIHVVVCPLSFGGFCSAGRRFAPWGPAAAAAGNGRERARVRACVCLSVSPSVLGACICLRRCLARSVPCRGSRRKEKRHRQQQGTTSREPVPWDEGSWTYPGRCC